VKIVVGITGASGVQLGVRLVSALKGHEVTAIISDEAWRLMDIELGKRPAFKGVTVLGGKDFEAPISSGSCLFDGMAVVPCSMKTLSGIANGYADTLVIRVADNALRIGRKLVLVPRETPLSLSAIENMAKLRTAGAIILPPVLAFYNQPRTVDDMVDYVVGKVLDSLGIENHLYRRWAQ
jgi:4-hydroxy-3-polyprenylbenzoate decarboxylase